MSMYDPKNPALSISLDLDEHGKVRGLIFAPRKRQLTDGIAPDELEDRAAWAREHRRVSQPAPDIKRQQPHKLRAQPQPGELPPGWYGRKDR